MLQLEYLRSQCLAQIEDGTTTKLAEVNLLAHLLTYLIVGLDLLCILKRNLLVLILHLTVGNNDAVAVYLEVALVGIDDHVKILVTAEYLGDHVAETLLKDTHQCGTVDVLGLLELLEGLYHAWTLLFFLCHSYFLLET